MLQTFKADLFKTLGHPTRIRILERLREREHSVSELCTALEQDPSSISQQLAVLRKQRILVGRKQGTSVYYQVVDDHVFDLLDIARRMFDQQLETLQAMARDDDADVTQPGT